MGAKSTAMPNGTSNEACTPGAVGSKQRDERHPEQQELDAQVDRTRFSEDVRIRRLA
jgi:hypothetical protein